MEETKTKKCSKCGKELPLFEFYKSGVSKDGYQSYCKRCTYCARKESQTKHGDSGTAKTATRSIKTTTMVPSSPKKVYTDERLASISNKDLIAEIKARGFVGKLTYTYSIEL